MRNRPWIPILIATAIFSALSIWMAIASEAFLEADACLHYLYARFALHEPHYFVNVWGRPFVTAIYALPAAVGGRLGVRFMSLALALAIASIVYRIAKNLKFRWPQLAFIFTLAQPLVFLHSFSELTELPFAVLLALGFWAYQRRKLFAMAAIAALTPLARPEGFALILLAAAALIAYRRWWWILILPIPLLAWQYAGWRIFGHPVYDDRLARHLPAGLHWLLWLKHEWPYAGKSLYHPGQLLRFVAEMPTVASPIIFPALVIGLAQSLRRRDRMLIAIIPLLFLVAHSLLYWLGRMASSGELRYMLTVAPMWALLMACGWEWIFVRFNWRAPVLWAGAAALVPIALHPIYPVLPLVSMPDWIEAKQLARWYRTSATRTQYPMLVTSHPAIIYYLDVSPTDARQMRDWSKQTVLAAPPGTLLIWDEIYGKYNSSADRSVSIDEIKSAGWTEDFDAEEVVRDDYWRIFRSPLPATR